MRQYKIPSFLFALLQVVFLICRSDVVNAIARLPLHAVSYRQKSSSPAFSRRNAGHSMQGTIPVARTKKAPKKSPTMDDPFTDDPFAVPMTTQEIYAGLGPVGRCVAGTVEVAISTGMEYLTGFFGGYILGSVTDVPRFVFKGLDADRPLSFLQELSQRYGRMHQKSQRWARSWGEVSATFAGMRVATRVLRGGKEDEWNSVISSAAAGAFFARKGGPQAMLSGAVTYGGMMYLFSGGFGSKKEPFRYKDQPLDFAR